MVHPALTFAPTLQRALAVTQAEQQLRQARTIRDKETAIFEASITDINPRGELSEALVDLHTRVTDVELSHDQLIPQRISTSHALHAHIRDSVLTSSIKTAAMLKEVLSWPDKTPNSAFSINNDLDTLIRVFTMRKEILRAVREARGGCSELLDHFNTLHTMGCAWERRQHPVSEKIISLHDEIASLLVEIEEHIGSDQETRNNRLLSLSQATGPLIAQDSTRLQSKVENWFRWSADGSDATRDVTADRAIEISSWIISRMTQLDELISSLKKSNGALSLRLAATTALDKAEMASIEECIAASSLMLKGADDLEKSFLDPNAVFSKEDVVKHAFDVFDRNAKLVGSDGVKRVQRDASNLVKDTYQELEIVKALWESKRLFQLDGRPLDSHSQPNSEIFDPSSAPTFASQASRASVISSRCRRFNEPPFPSRPSSSDVRD
ncbi:hypothetical protein A4X09_0g3073 [Tilletia walkeri]|uniref:Uncharacterized protein n=1 Tax=Tilletia walkeri TaxID=117179 RepID=A0A8X7N8S1_9BASI|nr:hypothetical protein A4X09_0g3073 [Tilletia walkeri]